MPLVEWVVGTDISAVHFAFDSTYVHLPQRFYANITPTAVESPSLIAFNFELAAELGLLDSSVEALDSEDVAVFAGNRMPKDATPIALAYAGHQFGGFVPQLGDGRAILLGELRRTNERFDVQLKGAGRTPFSRGGDGRAALGPVLREYLLSEAMAALGVPTTRALAAVGTGEFVARETLLPGAVLTRVAKSHIRIGTFQYFATRGDRDALVELTRYALDRHFPAASSSQCQATALLECVMDVQAKLIARWQALGFVHGVMNTDNMSISGETIDYGPCAFLDSFSPTRTFSSIDHFGRYAFKNQPVVAQWNLARLAECLVPLVDGGEDAVVARLTQILETFPARFVAAYTLELRQKLGFSEPHDGDLVLAEDLLQRMADDRVDYTLAFRRLCDAAASSDDSPVAALFVEPSHFAEWATRWRHRLAEEQVPPERRIAMMRSSNPGLIPRNHRVEEMIAAAIHGDLAPFERLHRALRRPYEDQPAFADLAKPPGEEQWNYRTFCGT